MESELKLNNNQVLVMVILGAVIFFIFVLPLLDDKKK